MDGQVTWEAEACMGGGNGEGEETEGAACGVVGHIGCSNTQVQWGW